MGTVRTPGGGKIWGERVTGAEQGGPGRGGGHGMETKPQAPDTSTGATPAGVSAPPPPALLGDPFCVISIL